MTKLSFTAVILLLITVFITNVYAQSEISGAWTQIIVDAPDRVGENRDFDVSVKLENGVDIAGFAVSMEFNKRVIRAEEVKEGTFLSFRGPTYWGKPDIDNSDGAIRHIVCIARNNGGRSGDGTLFTVRFEARDPGTSPINIKAVELADSQMRSVTVNTRNDTVTVIDVPAWDTNADGCTDLYDLVFVGQNFGKYIPSSTFPNPDVNRNGRVDITDLMMVIRHYGDGCSSVPAPPKPGSEDYDMIRKILRGNTATTWGRMKNGR